SSFHALFIIDDAGRCYYTARACAPHPRARRGRAEVRSDGRSPGGQLVGSSSDVSQPSSTHARARCARPAAAARFERSANGVLILTITQEGGPMKKWIPVLFTVAIAFRTAPAAAAGTLDHLFCFDVNDKLKPGVVVDLNAELQPDFTTTGCTVTKVTKFCVPATKVVLPPPPSGPDIVGQPLRDDYICYQVKCSKKVPDRLVVDQFGQRRARKFQPSELCVPARKAPPPCFRIGDSKRCGGVCPNDAAGVGTACRFDDSLQDCTCGPQPCGGKPDKTNQCGGACPAPMICQLG